MRMCSERDYMCIYIYICICVCTWYTVYGIGFRDPRDIGGLQDEVGILPKDVAC